MASTQQTELFNTFFHYLLGEGEIATLFDIASEGIPAADISVSTLIDSIRFSEESFTDLKSAVQGSTLANRNKPWPNVELEAGAVASGHLVKITLNSDLAHINVARADTNWVHGRTARLSEYLESHAGSKALRKDEPKIILLFLVMFLVIAGFWIFKTQDADTVRECLARAKKSEEAKPFFNWSMAIMLGGGLIAVLFMWLRYRDSKTQLRTNGVVTAGSWWSRASTGDRISAIGVPIAEIAAIATVMSALSDTFGK
ncbi:MULTISPECIES: hypothetical protein [Streptomyces]|uniref:Uncharacterized protein n=1 Tax=Streptomyces evansiae TaxID=3075535 RepID=A0ABU2RC92_9ACTN|nr:MULTISPECIES: hypothetical protein [unclassified Streptomyces]MDT0413704.1 hypothetical protein [Streptomyces sp. DSM 41979]MYQ55904.1 hypothetical protein [Streptomyces sp. SID4926]